jgi:cysteinyl-tRNA synthetase
MAIRFFNTMSRRLEEFRPLEDNRVRMYTCGPTVYDNAHIGNFRTYCFEDLLCRWLRFRGFKVTQVMNITDVEDKIIRKAREQGIPISSLTPQYIQAFFEDLESLNIEKAEHYPRATEHVPQMVRLIQILLDKGVAYRSDDGSVYFNIAKFPAYGKLAHIEVDELKAGARVKHDDYEKESASDFALWKAWDEEDADTFWETDLGKGRPGWHIECSAMSMKYLGNTFDIHTGGVDNIFPHHENEIAQSEAATGAPFVVYWLHSEHLLVSNQKMAKRLGNFFTLRDLIAKGYNPMAVRYLYLSSHYRSKLNFTLPALDAAQSTLRSLRDFLLRMSALPEALPGNPAIPQLLQKARADFEGAMDDDLNTPAALAALFTFVSAVNIEAEGGKMGRKDGAGVRDLIFDLDRVLGLRLAESAEEKDLEGEIRALIDERQEARKTKNFARADEIRDLLKARGIILEDTPGGVRWKKM